MKEGGRNKYGYYFNDLKNGRTGALKFGLIDFSKRLN